MNPEDEVSAQECEEENDPILEFAIEYVLHRTYPSGLSKEKKVKCCPVCQRMNKKLTLERPELHPVPVKSPWHHLGMDSVGPISGVNSYSE